MSIDAEPNQISRFPLMTALKVFWISVAFYSTLFNISGEDHLVSNRQSGNVLFLIIIAVALFAALSYAITFRNSDNGSASKEKASASLAQIQNYASSLRAAVQRLMLSNGCLDDQLNFSSNNWVDNNGYSNNFRLSDGKCDVFSPSGGGVAWQKPPVSSSTGAREYLVSGIFGVWNVGIDSCEKTELILFTTVNRDVCLLANTQNGIINTGGNPPHSHTGEYSTPPNYLAFGWASNNGGTTNYGCGAHLANAPDAAPELLGKMAGCYQTSSSRRDYYYYEVLLAR